MSDLKPCPFCGDRGEPCEDGRGYVWCDRCKACGPPALNITSEDAVMRWNRRPLEDAVRKVVEEMRKSDLETGCVEDWAERLERAMEGK